MRILIAHNHYGDHATGGEALVFSAEASLLERRGIEVLKYERTNSEIFNKNFAGKFKAFNQMYWSMETLEEAGRIMDKFRPDILHVHNYKYLITPSVFHAARQRGIKTVLTLHNYRLIVPCGNFMTRKGIVCERCLTGNPVNILLRRCSSGSLFKSYLQYRLFTKTKYQLHQLTHLVNIYIVLTEFAKKKLILGGVPEEKIKVKPNFIESKTTTNQGLQKRERAVFVGRLSYEKGCLQLIENWSGIDYPLYLIGNGPLHRKAQIMAEKNPNIFLLGSMENEKVQQFLRESTFLIFPSTLYEGMPLTILEAMAAGIPVIATDLGPRSEIVKNGITGFLYNPDDSKDFKNIVNRIIRDKMLQVEIGVAARNDYLAKYTSEINFKDLFSLYSRLLTNEGI